MHRADWHSFELAASVAAFETAVAVASLGAVAAAGVGVVVGTREKENGLGGALKVLMQSADAANMRSKSEAPLDLMRQHLVTLSLSKNA